MSKWIRQGSKLPMESSEPAQNMSTKAKPKAQTAASGKLKSCGTNPEHEASYYTENYQGRVK